MKYCNLEIEEVLIGGLITFPNMFPAVAEILRPDIFYKDELSIVAEVIIKMINSEENIDMLTVSDRLKKENKLELVGVDYLMKCLDRAISPSMVEIHAKQVYDYYLARELILATDDMKKKSLTQKDILDKITDISNIWDGFSQEKLPVVRKDMNKILDKYQSVIDEAVSGKSAKERIKTGYDKIDNILDIDKGDLIIIAARPSVGKTAFAISLMINMLKEDKCVALFSLEMSDVQILNRIIANQTSIDSKKIKRGYLIKDEKKIVDNHTNDLRSKKLHIDDSSDMNIYDLKAKIMAFNMKHKLDIVMVDYLQLMTGRKNRERNRNEEIGEISRSLKVLAKKINIPIIALSQLNRDIDRRSNKKPILADLRESGSIEQDADSVVMIYVPDSDEMMPDGGRKIVIEKQRNGNTGEVEMILRKPYSRFEQFSDMQRDDHVSADRKIEPDIKDNLPF